MTLRHSCWELSDTPTGAFVLSTQPLTKSAVDVTSHKPLEMGLCNIDRELLRMTPKELCKFYFRN